MLTNNLSSLCQGKYSNILTIQCSNILTYNVLYFSSFHQSCFFVVLHSLPAQVLNQIPFLNENNPLSPDINNFYCFGKLREECEIVNISQIKCKCAITEITGLNEIFISQATDIEIHARETLALKKIHQKTDQ